MEKILIITYYWPPSGGSGVQRWLKLSKYLSKLEFEVHILTVNPKHASYFQLDNELIKEIESGVNVHYTNSFEPLNILAKFIGKDKVPTAGFSNVNTKNWKLRILNIIRSHLFIPDPRVFWNFYAFKKAISLIRMYQIKTIITSSPPHSTQLIGLKLKKKLGNSICWITDFRDPWTDIYYYKILGHSKISHYFNRRYEKQVIDKTDGIITVGEKFKKSFLTKTKKIHSSKINVIPNGYDSDDFQKTILYKKNKVFTISYVGVLSDIHEPQVIIEVIERFISKIKPHLILLKFIGVISPKIRGLIENKIGNIVVFVSAVSHKKAIKYMIKSDVLLLFTPGKKGVIPGKTFEYLASGTTILCIGKGDSQIIIEKCMAGRGFSRSNQEGILDFLEKCFDLFYNNKILYKPKWEIIKNYSRENQAKQLITLINRLKNHNFNTNVRD